jgi:translocation and assembly module TamA
VEAGAAVDADTALAGQAELQRKLKDAGYPFAKVGEPDVVVDHATHTATLRLPVDTGGSRRFGTILVTGEKPPFDAKHVARIARFKPDQPYDQAMVDDLRRALIATGVAGGVDVTPVPGKDDSADIRVAMEPAKLRTIAGEAGYGTGEGVRVEVSWTHRNLIKPEGAVTLRGVAGTREQALGAVLRQANFGVRDRVFNARIGASHFNRPAFDARTFEIGASLERQSNIIWQKRWTWSIGGELIATDERDKTSLLTPRATYFVGALPLSLGYDRSNDLLDPTRGFRLGVRFSPEVSLRSGTNLYVRSQFDGSGYFPVAKNVTLAGRVRLGSILGAKRLGIAPSRRFYSGGGGSVRGFGYQRLGPVDTIGDPIGGRGLAEFALEARIRWKDFGIVPFVDGGNVYTKSTPDFSGFRYGAGIGLRYHSSFGPIRIDVGTPIKRRKGDSPVTVFVSLGQAF